MRLQYFLFVLSIYINETTDIYNVGHRLSQHANVIIKVVLVERRKREIQERTPSQRYPAVSDFFLLFVVEMRYACAIYFAVVVVGRRFLFFLFR